MPLFAPPYNELTAIDKTLGVNGYALLNPTDFSQYTNHSVRQWLEVQQFWNHLPPDNYLKDGGHYRKRRHSSLIIKENSFEIAPHRPHWQPISYNALHGGIDRWFEPCDENFLNDQGFTNLLYALSKTFWLSKGFNPIDTPWFVEVHQFRIDTTDGIGRPTPEGAHRDGVDFVAVLLIDRKKIKGGESRIFLNDSPQGQRFTLNEPLSLVILDDHKVIHETTPIQPIDPLKTDESWRDTLVLTYRKKSFQDKSELSE